MLEHQWHDHRVQEVAHRLNSDIETGLTSAEAVKRQSQFGANQLVSQKKESLWSKFLQQLNQPIQYILLAAGAVTALFKDWIDAGVIFAVAFANALIGLIQEAKAENAIAALAAVVETEATVIRDDQKIRISSTELVPGDLVLLGTGDRVPADLRLVEVFNLQIDESGLTGESAPVEKDVESLAPDTPLAERSNMVYAGSLVGAGQGSGFVVATAAQTETGRISQLIEQNKTLSTPLTRKIHKFSRTLLYAVLALATMTFAIGVGQGDEWVEVFKAAVALAVSAVPEGLPAVVTITLAVGVSRMARRNAIIRKLAAVETLGSTTVICSDKTGTLTENQMTVQEIYAGGQHYTVSGVGYTPQGEILWQDQPVNLANAPELAECLQVGLLCNDSHLQEEDSQWQAVGDPTEAALLVVAGKAGLVQSELEEELPRIDVIPFDPGEQYMATLHQQQSHKLTYVKGSTEAILQRCQQKWAGGNMLPLDSEKVQREANAMAQKGLRVLAFARKQVAEEISSLEPAE